MDTTTTVKVEKEGLRWIARCSYEDRAIPKAAGFRWDGTRKQWYTTDANVAATLTDPEMAAAAQERARVAAEERQVAIDASRASDATVALPCPQGLAYLPYQRAGIATAISRPSVLFGDEMGLGKTVEAIGVINADETIFKVLIFCPASLKLNWKRELQKWLCRQLTIQIATAQSCEPSFTDITIVNYDVAEKLKAKLHAQAWDLVILDEMHYLKNPDAKRTVAIVGREAKKGKESVAGIAARRRIGLTGTPIPNRPVEGWPIFHYLDPVEFKSFFGYAKRYCAASQGRFGWDFSGSSNLHELQEKLRASIMIRRLKADVLTELPAKRRAVIEISSNGATSIVAAEQRAWEQQEELLLTLRAAVQLAKASDKLSDYEDAVSHLAQATRAAFTELAKLRHDTAVAKIPYVVEHVRDSIDNGKVIVFAHHHDVIEALAKEFGDAAVVVYGSTPMVERQANVDRFQTDPGCTIFIGGIQAAGVGLTLTASSHVIFAELDWVPGNVTQAEDRAHRIGQTNMVLVQHLVLEGSLDARMATILVEKQEVIAAALDNEVEAMPIAPVAAREQAATENTTRAAIAEVAASITLGQSEAIHLGLKMLAGRCDGAQTLDGAGYSRIDVEIGHSLADAWMLTPRQAALGAKLVNKYRRQLPAELVAIVKAVNI